ncbi:MAG: hypothetical protein GWO23_11030 [Gammaproteobacteria bacterium]|nr:hypothetical protein [Gammaproteobacteria bacterium]
MNYCSSLLFALLVSISLLSGCATTGTASGSSAAEATATTQAPASDTHSQAGSVSDEPECD